MIQEDIRQEIEIGAQIAGIKLEGFTRPDHEWQFNDFLYTASLQFCSMHFPNGSYAPYDGYIMDSQIGESYATSYFRFFINMRPVNGKPVFFPSVSAESSRDKFYFKIGRDRYYIEATSYHMKKNDRVYVFSFDLGQEDFRLFTRMVTENAYSGCDKEDMIHQKLYQESKDKLSEFIEACEQSKIYLQQEVYDSENHIMTIIQFDN